MRDFPVGKLNPLPGRFCWEPIGLGIEVPLAPFTFDEETIETSIFLSTVTLPTTDILTLSGQTFRFPTNPEPGYIDGGMYVEHAHHPVDVTLIRFGPVSGGTVQAEFELLFIFEFEGLDDYRNTPWTLRTSLSSPDTAS